MGGEREREIYIYILKTPSLNHLSVHHCHPCIRTTCLSYSFPIFQTSATVLRGTPGKSFLYSSGKNIHHFETNRNFLRLPSRNRVTASGPESGLRLQQSSQDSSSPAIANPPPSHQWLRKRLGFENLSSPHCTKSNQVKAIRAQGDQENYLVSDPLPIVLSPIVCECLT